MQFHLHKTQTNSLEQNWLLIIICYYIEKFSKFKNFMKGKKKQNTKKKKKASHIIEYSLKRHTILYIKYTVSTGIGYTSWNTFIYK